MNPKEKLLYGEALNKKGLLNQLIIAIEENMELSQAITKYIREEENLYEKEVLVEKIAEEICDVEIMCNQLKINFNIENRVKSYKTQKLNRLRKRLDILENNKIKQD